MVNLRHSQTHLKTYLIAIIAHLRKMKTKCNYVWTSDVKPNKIASYVSSIQMYFSMYWGYNAQLLCGLIVNHPKHGLKTLSHSKCRNIQAESFVEQIHNLLLDENVMKLYKYSYFRDEQPLCLLQRVIFYVSIISACRPGMLSRIQMNQISKTKTK